jgi:hypothetical protein
MSMRPSVPSAYSAENGSASTTMRSIVSAGGSTPAGRPSTWTRPGVELATPARALA